LEEGFSNYDWDELPRHAQEAAKILGYNRASWDGSKKVSSSVKSWRELSAAEQAAAKVLCYDRKKWDGVDGGGSADDIEDERDASSQSHSKSTISSLMLSSPTDDHGSYSQSAISAKRLGSETSPCYDDLSFDHLPGFAMQAAELLGWTRSSWNANDPVPAEEKAWKDLTEVEKDACKSLGWSEHMWDAHAQDESVASVSTAPSRTYGGKLFDDLPPFVKEAAATLGYTSSTWNNDGSIAVEDKDWDQLNPSQQSAASVLGFSEQTWNGPAGPQATNASALPDGQKKNTERIEFIPGYKYYKIRDWSRLPIEVQRAALTMGYNEIVWKNGNQSPVDDMYWEDMSPKLRAAARKLGFHADSWNRVVRLNLKMLKHRLCSV
jgi:hypothetical protein